MSELTECWLPIEGFEGLYEVSSLGRVRSLDRTVVSWNKWGPIAKHLHGGIIAQRVDYYGYLAVTLYRSGQRKTYRVHRLVGEAFHGRRPPDMYTRHGPEGRKANSATDIRYGTRAENERDKIRDGTFRHGGGIAIGERHGSAKLTAILVAEIRKRHAAGQRKAELARAFGVTHANICRIVNRETWKGIT